DDLAELHQGGRHRGGPRVLFGEQRGHVGQVPFGGGRSGVTGAVHGAGDHAPHVRVHHRGALAVGEGGHRAGGVLADTGQGQQGFHVGGHDVPVLGGDHRGRLVQPHGAARVAELAPRAQHFALGGGGQVG